MNSSLIFKQKNISNKRCTNCFSFFQLNLTPDPHSNNAADKSFSIRCATRSSPTIPKSSCPVPVIPISTPIPTTTWSELSCSQFSSLKTTATTKSRKSSSANQFIPLTVVRPQRTQTTPWSLFTKSPSALRSNRRHKISQMLEWPEVPSRMIWRTRVLALQVQVRRMNLVVLRQIRATSRRVR